MLQNEQKNRIGFIYIMNLVKPACAYGRENLRRQKPYRPGQEEVLQAELQNIEKTLQIRPSLEQAFSKLEQVISQTKDIRASIKQIGAELTEVDLFELKRFLLQLNEISPIWDEISKDVNYQNIIFADATAALKTLDPENTRTATFHISAKHFPELAQIRRGKKEIEQKLRAATDESEKLKLQKQRTKLASHEQREEQKAALALSDELVPWQKALLQNTEALGRLDLTIQKAKLAAAFETCLPQINKASISFDEMTSPQIADILEKADRTFTPLTLSLTEGATVITGANMGGKSVALRTLALNIMLIHHGFYPFAKKACCPLLENIHLISDDLEATERGLSSFGGEIAGLQEILSGIDDTGRAGSLILLDEFARGTNPEEGGAIARAVCAYLSGKKAYTVMTTHYEGVAALANAHYQVAGLRKMPSGQALALEMKNMSMSERIAKIASYMDFGLVKASAETKLPADAVNICKMLGLEEGIMEKIKNLQKK